MKYSLPNGGEFHLDEGEVGKLLKRADVAAAVAEAGENVAAQLRAQPDIGAVYVERYTTDRAAVSVTIPLGVGDELKHGRLMTAALRAGLEVGGR